MARVLAAFAALLLVAILAVCVASFALSRGWQRERLRAAAEALLADALSDEVAIDAIEGPLVPRLEVRGLRIGAGETPSLAVERATLRIAWRRSLEEWRLVLDSAEVEGAHLALSRGEQGAWELPPWLAPQEEPPSEDEGAEQAPLAIRIEHTRLRDLSARIAWEQEEREAALLLTADVALEPWSLAAPREGLRGRLRLHAQGEGAATRWLDAASLEASLDGPRIGLESLEITGGGRPPLRLGVPAALVIGDGRVRFEALELRSEDQALVARGAVSTERFHDLHVELRELDLALVTPLVEVETAPGGRVTGSVSLDGPLLQPEGEVDLVWRDPRIGDWQAERVALQASGDGRSIRIRTLSLEGLPGGPARLLRPAQLRVTSDGVELLDFALESAGQALVANGGVSTRGFRALELELRALDVALLARLLGIDGGAGGTFGGQVRLDGSFRSPTGRVDLHWQDPALRGWQGQRVALQAEADGRRVLAEAQLLQGGREALAAELAFPGALLEQALRGRLPALSQTRLPDGLRATLSADAAGVAPFTPLLPEALRELEGELSGELTVQGGPEPRWDGELVLSEASLPLPGRDPIAPLRVELALRPDAGALHIERLEVRAPTFTLKASGAPGLAGPADLAIELAAPDLEAMASALELAAPLVGTLTAKASLQGHWPRPALQADATWTHPAPGLARPHRVDALLASREHEIAGKVSVHQRSRVAARGELRMPYGDEGLPGLAEAAQRAVLELHAEDFDLATVAPLLPRVARDLRGRADLELTVRAGPERPSFSGSLQVEAGSVRVPILRQTFEPIALDARFREDTLHIETLRIGEQGARAEASGRVHLGTGDAPGRVDVDVSLVDLPLARSRPLTTDASGELSLEGPFDALRLEGEIALSDTQVRLVDARDPALREIEVITSDAQREARQEMRERVREAGAYEQASIDVAVTVPRNTWVRGRGADIDLAGTLRVEKAPGDVLRLSGEVAAVRGNYRFQGKRFDIRRGSVAFAGTADADPILDIEAVHRVRGVTIVIHLTGRASEPVVSLTSEPPLPEDDVLSYLFFGRPTSELGAEQPARDLDQAATALAAGIALREATRLVEDVAPVDTIDVGIEEDGTAGNVGVGKYLTDDLFIRYERGFGEEAVDGVKLELRLDENWSVEGDATGDASAGADLVWSFDY